MATIFGLRECTLREAQQQDSEYGMRKVLFGRLAHLLGPIYGGKAMFALVLLGVVKVDGDDSVGKGARDGVHQVLARSDTLPSGRLKTPSSKACLHAIRHAYKTRMQQVIADEFPAFLATFTEPKQKCLRVHLLAADAWLRKDLTFYEVEGLACECRRFAYASDTNGPPKKG